MVHFLPASERAPSKSRTVRFEGAAYGTNISFFAVDTDPGQGPGLHIHPYAETWIVKRGRALMRAGGESFEAGPNDIIVVAANTPHGFKNIGEGPLEMMCIHENGAIIQTDLEDAAD